MNPKKNTGEKAKNAGISLEPEIKQRATRFAKKSGFKSLSALTHKLLSDYLEEAAQKAEKKSEEKQQSAVKKIKRARGKEDQPAQE